MINNKVIFPGSFDPITFGHLDVINSSLKLFKTVIIGVGLNQNKKHMFSVNERKKMIQSLFKGEKRIIVKEYSGLTIDFCKKENTKHIVRGIRNTLDFDYENQICLCNEKLNKEIETIFMPAKTANLFISSSIIRDIIINKDDLNTKLSTFLPKKIITQIKKIIYNKSRNII